MSLDSYPLYKKSGINWYEDVPHDWGVEPLFALAHECSTPNKGMIEDNLLSLSYGRVINKDINSNDGLLPESFETYQVVEPNDIVLRLTDLQNDKRSLRSAIVKERGIITSAYLAIRPTRIDATFLNYLLRAYDLTKVFYSMGGGLRQSMKFSDVKRLPLILPSHLEQKSIVTFLDHETAKIDMLVNEQKKLIELLKEKRQVIVSDAVTKGLDTKVKLKNSGVEWLEEIPEHWTTLKIKRLSAVQRGASPRPIDDPKYFDDAGEYGWVRISDVSSSKGVLKETEQKLSHLGSSLSVKIEPEQLFISIAGTVGKPCISSIKACIHDGFVYFPNLKINPWWLFRIFEAGVCYGGLGKLGTQLNLNTDTVGSISIGVPPDSEIESILDYIHVTLEKLDGLISEAQRVIDLSLERKSSLISAAVTGQIDVRNYHPKEIA
ncbi:RMtype1_S_MspEN3ORF6650P_TRD2-CR2_like domain containing protein [Oxalobacteraceae bacterium]